MTFEGLRVLIAEDETLIRLDLRQMLEEHGMIVCGEARDGLEAVELARETQPDLAEPIEVEVKSSSGHVWPLRVQRKPDGTIAVDVLPE